MGVTDIFALADEWDARGHKSSMPAVAVAYYQAAAELRNRLAALPQQPAGEAVAWMRWHPRMYEGKKFPNGAPLDSRDVEDGWQERPLIFGDTTPPQPSAEPQKEAQGAVAWYCEWLEDGEYSWSQYHDAFDPLPETWDDPPDRITPLYAATPPAPVDVRRLRELLASWRHEANLLREFSDKLSGDTTTHRAARDIDERANALESALLSAQPSADAGDGVRLDWIESMIKEHCAVWMLPCGESLRLVQVRHIGDCENYPTVEGLRAAIDAAIAAQPRTTP